MYINRYIYIFPQNCFTDHHIKDQIQ
uniref:Uncharacterized protein n=1 Tax=Anguilla anguilla TaxID=7936 RepID=A0A0E9SHN6_ANGAN